MLNKIEVTRRQANKMQGVKNDEEEFHRLRTSIEKEEMEMMKEFKNKKYK